MAETVVIITGAVPLQRVLARHACAATTVIAADAGLDHALQHGLAPDLVVGDMDSISPDGAEWAAAHARLVRVPTDKSATDTELAITEACRLQPDHLVLIGGPDGTRLDHSIAAVGALGAPPTASVALVEAWWGTAYLRVVHAEQRATIDVAPGTVFSVLAMHGAATGVSVTGARWDLDAVELPPLAGWGVSNEAVEARVTVEVGGGVAIVIIPQGAQP